MSSQFKNYHLTNSVMCVFMFKDSTRTHENIRDGRKVMNHVLFMVNIDRNKIYYSNLECLDFVYEISQYSTNEPVVLVR